MWSRLPWGIPGTVLLVLTGCAPMTSGVEAGAPTPQREIRAMILDRPAVPEESDMFPDVDLVTYEVQRDDKVVRDTIHGATEVARWLARARAQTQSSATPFSLTAEEVVVCEAATVEAGRYAIRDLTDLRYVAVWRPSGSTWKLEHVWLSPPRTVRAGTLASGCAADKVAIPVFFGLAVGGSGSAGMGAVADSLAALDDQTGPKSFLPAVRVWAGVNVSSHVAIKLDYTFRNASRLEARDTAAIYERTATESVKAKVFSLTGELRFGPFSLEAGPAWAAAAADYQITVERIPTPYIRTDSDDLTQVGAVARASARFPIGTHLRALGSLGYDYFPGVELVNTVPGATVEWPGPILLLGLEWVL